MTKSELIKATRAAHNAVLGFEAAERSWPEEREEREAAKAYHTYLLAECRERGVAFQDVYVSFF